MKTRSSLEQQIRDVPKLNLADLKTLYKKLCGNSSEKDHRLVLEIFIQHQLQKVLISRLRSRLFQILNAAESIQTAVSEGSGNTILICEWKGKCHEVVLLHDGAYYDGDRFDSLSAISSMITHGKRTTLQLFGHAE